MYFPHRLVVFVLLYVVIGQCAAASPCQLNSEPALQSASQLVDVKSVIDGDTVRLGNKKLVRFIAINAPEIDHERGRSDPFAEQARDALQDMVNTSRGKLRLVYGTGKRDRHGRLLAHVFTPGGDNVTARLIGKGLGFWIVVPPNLAFMECYRQQERQAREKKTGIWSTSFSKPVQTSQINQSHRGFQLIRGKITRIGKGKVFTWLNFGTDVALRIHNRDMKYFADMQINQLANRVVTARGWLFPYKKQLVIQIRHPASIEVE